MKRKPGEGLLRRLCGLVTRNFGLKLLSLALAIVIYEILKPKADEPDPELTTPSEQHVSSTN